MFRRMFCLFVIFVAATLVYGQAAAPKTENTKPISSLAWLVGGVWTADASKLGPGMQRIETRYQWSDNDAFLRFNTHFVFDKGTAKTYDGNFYWNSNESTLSMWYMNSNNVITTGPVKVAGDTMTITFHGTDFEEKEADMKVEVTRKTNDDYHWSLQEKQPDGWKELMNLEYIRKATDNATS